MRLEQGGARCRTSNNFPLQPVTAAVQINERQTKEILAKNLTFDTQPLQSSRNPVFIGSSSTYYLLREVLPLFTIDVVLQDRTHSSLG
jgi:hypothetical protein